MIASKFGASTTFGIIQIASKAPSMPDRKESVTLNFVTVIYAQDRNTYRVLINADRRRFNAENVHRRRCIPRSKAEH
jgi:hypothetical protein